ncbi:hypothetical protein XENTR_v10004303 [Xenopus tropicalis]|nr:hypothetical protein XENTR_v10004303 [Xenopus tropicalis]
MTEFGEAADYLRKSAQELMKVQTIAFDGKKKAWIPDDKEAYIEVEIKDSSGGKVNVETKDKKVKTLLFPAGDLHVRRWDGRGRQLGEISRGRLISPCARALMVSVASFIPYLC